MSAKNMLPRFAALWIVPFVIAAIFATLQAKGIWSPKTIASGHVYSPAVVFEANLYEKPAHSWKLIVLSDRPDSPEVLKWSTLPAFFPKSSLQVTYKRPDEIPMVTFVQLQEPLNFSLNRSGSLLLEDSRGFIAMSFAADVVVQDVMQDLKRILPKNSRRTSS